MAARNVGSLDGSIPAMLRVDGKAEATQQITLHHDAEATVRWKVAIPTGVHTVAVDDLSATLRR